MVVGIQLWHLNPFIRVIISSYYECPFRCSAPQVVPTHMLSVLDSNTLSLQIKNIKLHIVTDIKVNFNSMLDFRISQFGWGEGTSKYKEKRCTHFLASFSSAPQAFFRHQPLWRRRNASREACREIDDLRLRTLGSLGGCLVLQLSWTRSFCRGAGMCVLQRYALIIRIDKYY